MGTKLVLNNADFSESGMPETKVYFNEYSYSGTDYVDGNYYYGLCKSALVAYGIFGKIVSGAKFKMKAGTMNAYIAKIENSSLTIIEQIGSVTSAEDGVVEMDFNKAVQVKDDSIIVFKPNAADTGISWYNRGGGSRNDFNSSDVSSYTSGIFISDNNGIIIELTLYGYE